MVAYRKEILKKLVQTWRILLEIMKHYVFARTIEDEDNNFSSSRSAEIEESTKDMREADPIKEATRKEEFNAKKEERDFFSNVIK